MIQIRIDQRESHLLHALSSSLPKKQFEKKLLEVGDIQLWKDDQPLVIIERKTFPDFFQSCRDGRYREQKHRLLQSPFPYKVYLFEGDCQRQEGRGRFKHDYWMQLCLRLMFKDRILVWVCSTLSDTIHWIWTLHHKLETQSDFFSFCQYPSVFSLSPPRSLPPPPPCMKKKKDGLTPSVVYSHQLQQIPHIAQQTASVLCKAYPTLFDLLEALRSCPSDVAQLNMGKTRILGQKTVDRLSQYFFFQ